MFGWDVAHTKQAMTWGHKYPTAITVDRSQVLLSKQVIEYQSAICSFEQRLYFVTYAIFM